MKKETWVDIADEGEIVDSGSVPKITWNQTQSLMWGSGSWNTQIEPDAYPYILVLITMSYLLILTKNKNKTSNQNY